MVRLRRGWFVVALVLGLVVAAGGAQAQSESASPRVQTWIGDHPGFDLAYTAAGIGLIVTGMYLLDPGLNDIAPLDGEGHRAHHRAPDIASDIAVFAGLPLALGLAYGADVSSSDHDSDNGWVGALRVPLVLAEAWIVTNAFAALIKNAGVCRPYAWNESTRTCSAGSPDLGDARWMHTAFLSGHSANIASAAGALLGLWLFPEQSNLGLGVVALGTSMLSLGVAILRVAAGAHSIADVSAGLALGFAVGLATSALHLTTRAPQASAASSPLTLTIAF